MNVPHWQGEIKTPCLVYRLVYICLAKAKFARHSFRTLAVMLLLATLCKTFMARLRKDGLSNRWAYVLAGV